jgi:hypothetical protein
MSMGAGPWVKATLSDTGSSCVEVQKLADGGCRVRDSKDKGEGPVLTFTKSEWEAFIDGAKKGEFD